MRRKLADLMLELVERQSPGVHAIFLPADRAIEHVFAMLWMVADGPRMRQRRAGRERHCPRLFAKRALASAEPPRLRGAALTYSALPGAARRSEAQPESRRPFGAGEKQGRSG